LGKDSNEKVFSRFIFTPPSLGEKYPAKPDSNLAQIIFPFFE